MGIVSSGKVAAFAWVNSTFVKIANAVPLSLTTPLAPTGSGSAGTGATASRGDHAHIAQAVRPAFIHPSGAWVTDVTKNDSATATNALGNLTLRPMELVTCNHLPLIITGLGVLVSTVGSGDSTAKVGIWRANADGTINWTQLVAQASLTTASTGVRKATFSAVTLVEGQYWIGGVPQGTAAAQFRGAEPNGYGIRLPHTDPGSGQVFDQILAYMTNGITGALPTTTPANPFSAVNNDFAMNVWMQVA